MKFTPEPPWHETSEALTGLLDSSLKAKRDAEPRREYLGASMMARECLRSVAYEFHGIDKDPEGEFSGRLYRVFDMGHDGEARMLDYLRLAGFDVRTHDDTGEEYAYTAVDGRMKGHVDGVIFGGPDLPGAPGWPALWENKVVSDRAFGEFQRDGVRLTRPLYYGQVQIYMAYLGLEGCLFTVINRDDGRIHAEWIALDVAHAQSVSDRGVSVILSSGPEDFPRIGRDETDFRCKFCAWRRRCWAPAVEARANKQAPAWMKGG